MFADVIDYLTPLFREIDIVFACNYSYSYLRLFLKPVLEIMILPCSVTMLIPNTRTITNRLKYECRCRMSPTNVRLNSGRVDVRQVVEPYLQAAGPLIVPACAYAYLSLPSG